MPDQFDVNLEDEDLLSEVEMTTNLMVAASHCDERLSTQQIDEILNVVRQRGGSDAAESGDPPGSV